MTARDERVGDEPTDRLTRLANVAREALEASPEWDDTTRAIVLLSDPREGGATPLGYVNLDTPEGLALVMHDMVHHLQALAHVLGGEVHFVPAPKLPDDPTLN